jgi:hypothetical protein
MSKPNGDKCPTCTRQGEQVDSTMMAVKFGEDAYCCRHDECSTMVFNRYEGQR